MRGRPAAEVASVWEDSLLGGLRGVESSLDSTWGRALDSIRGPPSEVTRSGPEP